MKRALFAWPGRAGLRATLPLVGAFVLVFLVFYGGASALSGFVPYRFHVDFPFEARVPFWPSWSWVYVSMDLLLALCPFVFRSRRALFPLFATLCIETLIGAVCFVAFPIETRFPERIVSGTSAGIFAFADILNLERNYLPSLHVAYAFTAAAAYALRSGWAAKLAFFAWAGAIALATLLIHEHHLLDIAAGVALSAACMRLVYARLEQPALLQAISLDWLCAREAYRFGLRHPRYWWIALVLTGVSLGAWRRRRMLRSGYCFLQLADDLLDGDRACDSEPLEVIDAVIAEIEAGSFGAAPLSRLAGAFSEDLRSLGTPDRDPVADVIALLRVMQRDRVRVRDRLLLEAEALRAHHRQTFELSVDLMLLASGSALRARAVPELIEAFGWCSSMRDLREDLAHGLINLPRHVVEGAEREGARSRAYADLLATASVQAWLARELSRAELLVARALERSEALGPQPGAATVRLFTRSIARFSRRQRQALGQHPLAQPAE